MPRTTITETGAEVTGTPDTAPAALSHDEQVAVIVTTMDQVPDAPESDGTEVTQVMLNAQGPAALAAAATLPNATDVAGRSIKVLDLHKRESDKGGEIPWYLIVDGVDLDTGEPVRFTCGAQTPCYYLAALYGWRSLPATVRIERAVKPTKAGNYPLNIRLPEYER